MTNIKKIIFTTIPFIPFNMLNAEIINPVFSGNWDVVLAYGGTDNCAKVSYEYYDIAKTPEEVGLYLINKDFPEPHCTWSVESLTYTNTDMPADFPGTRAQWQAVTNQTSSAKDTIVHAVCLRDSQEIDRQSIYVYPQYICPMGSRYSIDGQAQIKGCTTLPQVCEGDVVGRDLDYQWPFNKLGHVGLTTSYNDPYGFTGSVMQVMKDRPTIVEKVSFNEFKNDTAYWGDKYGLTGIPTISSKQSGAIIDEEIKQYNKGSKGTYKWYPTFIPIQSSETSVYNQWTHTWQVQDDKSYPEFRCDTFVDWVYYVGLKKTQMVIPFHQSGTESGYKVYKYDHFLDDPRDLYQDLLTIRDNESDLSSSPHQQNTGIHTGAL